MTATHKFPLQAADTAAAMNPSPVFESPDFSGQGPPVVDESVKSDVLVAWVTSNCQSKSKREEYVQVSDHENMVLRRKSPTFLSVLIFSSVSRFAFSSKRKSVQKLCLDFFVSVQIAVTTTRKSRHTYCTNLCFKENANFDTL